MKTMIIYEPAMCCSTGLCGVGIDPELLRISTVISGLQKSGIDVKRYNLSSAPGEFIKSADINALIMKDGVEILPVTVVDNKIVKTNTYPTNQELATLLEIEESAFASQCAQADCCGDDCCSEGCEDEGCCSDDCCSEGCEDEGCCSESCCSEGCSSEGCC